MMTSASQYKLVSNIADLAEFITGEIIPIREADGVRDGTREFRIEDVAYFAEMLGWLYPFRVEQTRIVNMPNRLPIQGALVYKIDFLREVFEHEYFSGYRVPKGIDSNVAIPSSLHSRNWSDGSTEMSWSLDYDLLASISGLELVPAHDLDALAQEIKKLQFTPLVSADPFRKLYQVLKPLNRFYFRGNDPQSKVFEGGQSHYKYATDPDEVESMTGWTYSRFRAYQLSFSYRNSSPTQRFIEYWYDNCPGVITFNRAMKNVTAVMGEHVAEHLSDPGHQISSSNPCRHYERVFTVPLTKIGTDGLKWRINAPAMTRAEYRSLIESRSGKSMQNYYPGSPVQISASSGVPRHVAAVDYDLFGFFGDLGWECDFHSLPWTGE